MTIYIRVDSSEKIGGGHVMRCLSLAEAFRKVDFDVVFVCQVLPGDMNKYISERGFPVIYMTLSQEKSGVEFSTEYLAWLGRSVIADAECFLEEIDSDKCTLVVTDHYAIDCEWQSHIRTKLNCMILAIDDLSRDHNADYILDQTVGCQESEYSALRKVFAGTKYALLKDDFSHSRERVKLRTKPEERVNILISMGSVDQKCLTIDVVRSLNENLLANFTVLLNSNSPGYEEVKIYCNNRGNIIHKDFSDDMSSLMLSNNIAVGTPGSTSWERACLGLPGIIIPVAENQKLICERLVADRLAISVSADRVVDEIVSAVKLLVKNWDEYSDRNMIACDGLGAARVVEAIRREL